MGSISVVIINYNTVRYLRDCLKSIERSTAAGVVVVDNASTDGSAAMVETEFPWIHLIRNEENPGYGAAANQAIAGCNTSYVLLLNSDTRLQPGSLEALSSYLDHQPEAAIVGPRLVNLDGSLQPSCYQFPTPLHLLLEESTLSRYFGRIPFLRDRYLRTWPHNTARSVPWVLGAALAIRRQAFVDIGGFDSSFFMYAEEIDLSYRLRESGWRTHFTPGATVTHVGGASTSQQRSGMNVRFFLSMVHFYRLHYSKLRMVLLLVIMKAIMVARLIRDTVRLRLGGKTPPAPWILEDIAAWRCILLYRQGS